MKLPAYPCYKPSGLSACLPEPERSQSSGHAQAGVEWLGDMPEHWDAKRLGDPFSFYKGGALPATEILLTPWQGRETVPAAKLVESHTQSVKLPAKSIQGTGESIQAGAVSIQPVTPTLQISGEPVQASAKPVDLTLQIFDLPPHLAEIVTRLPKRVKKEAARQIILSLCHWRPLSSANLARLLRRNQTYLLNEFLAPIVTDGALNLTIPQHPNHPQQRYRAAVPPEERQS